jgi:septum site-determining protein MinC
VYIIDLGEVNTAPEIIFQLSSILDKEEAKNRRVCLKLGYVDLNQAQLLSIKSLINGIDSTLSSIDTKSVETEKIALSLGIIVSNISAENTVEVAPAMPYKLAEELKEETIAEEHVLETESIVEEVVETQEQQPNEQQIQQQEEQYVQEIEAQGEVVEETQQTEAKKPQNDVQDELDVIFGSNPIQSSIFDIEQPNEVYEEREELNDIVVPEQEYTKEDIELEAFPTKYIKQTIRSGQVINYEGNIVIIGDCHPGCEITAFGDITVWGILSGIAHAGAGGNQKARVRALKMNAIQLRIANCYSRRPDSLNTVYIEKTNSFTPEEARIINNEIVVFKIND